MGPRHITVNTVNYVLGIETVEIVSVIHSAVCVIVHKDACIVLDRGKVNAAVIIARGRRDTCRSPTDIIFILQQVDGNQAVAPVIIHPSGINGRDPPELLSTPALEIA